MSGSALDHIDPAAVASFQAHLQKSTRILALLGAGLSAASGLPTFRGAGGMWKNHEATDLATPDSFEEQPDLVWQFYSYRRHMALQAKPNPAHFALAELARKKEGFLTLSQNVDGLSQRANHPSSQLHLLHGNLFDIKCFNDNCTYLDPDNLSDPVVPALAVESTVNPKISNTDKTGAAASSSLAAAMDASGDAAEIPEHELPHCPKCNSLLRPGVVWFGEQLSQPMLRDIDDWLKKGKVDLMLVIGTAAAVYPAAGYIEEAASKGARVAVINMDSEDLNAVGMRGKDNWMFQGDAGVIVPELFKSVIGDIQAGQ